MTASRPPSAMRHDKPARLKDAPAAPAPEFLPPLPPYRVLFGALRIAVLLWILLLLFLYVTTVFPHRNKTESFDTKTGLFNSLTIPSIQASFA